ncbi:MAG: type VI secretion system lipoprotein TssJ, partial [Candidatus Competibacteraceae bacterium]|nr:type VI secretion system lipoprotein TssJ [Candidatus Competibacteraceae bacterium]
MQRPIRLAYWLFVALLATACGSDPPQIQFPTPPPPGRIVVEFQADPQLNPGSSGQPSPLVVRLFELKSPASFESADFFSLYERADEVLGADQLGHEQLTLRPGEKRRLERTLADDTRHIALLAAYRNLDRAVWRDVVSVPPNQTTYIDVDLAP